MEANYYIYLPGAVLIEHLCNEKLGTELLAMIIAGECVFLGFHLNDVRLIFSTIFTQYRTRLWYSACMIGQEMINMINTYEG